MEILERFRKIIDGKNPVVLELGACDGYHSNELMKIIKEKERMYFFQCFEPNTDLHNRIVEYLKGHIMFGDGIIGIFPHAVGEKVGEMTFYKSGGKKVEKGKVVDRYYGSSSILKPTLIKKDYPDMTFSQSKVFVTTLDHHFSRFPFGGPPAIDFIWSDIQGAELAMIKGGLRTFKTVRYLYTEYMNGEHYEGQGIGIQSILDLLPFFEVVEDYGGDVLLRNKLLEKNIFPV